jgi:hypothetical protein
MRRLFLAVVACVAVGCGSSDRHADLGARDLSMSLFDMEKPADLWRMRCLVVDDAGVTHGCTSGGTGIGDHDDGGGLPNAPPPDASATATDLPFGAECLDNGQCQSDLCFDFRVRGQFCTTICTLDSDCPSPPAAYGCNGQGICKIQPTS